MKYDIRNPNRARRVIYATDGIVTFEPGETKTDIELTDNLVKQLSDMELTKASTQETLKLPEPKEKLKA